MPSLRLAIPLQPKQLQLLDLVTHSPATWLGYGGSRGGAKSHTARAVMLIRRLDNPKTTGCIFRRTYDLVRENHIEPLLQQYPMMRDWYRAGDKDLRLPNGSVIAFRYGETYKDILGMIGKEYMDFVVDQAEAFEERELNIIKSCTRWPGVDSTQCKLILTFNPGNVGHAFLKRIFYDRQYTAKEHPDDYAFLQAFGWDNVEWVTAALAADGLTPDDYYAWDDDHRYQYFITRSQYGRDLNAMPPAVRIGWLMGRMDVFGGQYFDVFSIDRHVHPATVEPWFNRWLGIDWGFAHDAACYWGAEVKPNHIHVYREFVGAGRSPRALAQEIVDRTPTAERPRIQTIALSHDAFARKDERDPVASQMGPVFKANGMPWPSPAGRDPVGAAALLYDMLRSDQLSIAPDCPRLAAVIPMVSRDDDDLEATVKFDGDDPYDALRHLVHHRIRQIAKPHEASVRERAAGIVDRLARWFYLHKNLPNPQPAIVRPTIVPAWTREVER